MSSKNSRPTPDSGTTTNSGKRNRVRTEKPRTTALSRVRIEAPKPPRGSKPPKPVRERLPDGEPVVIPLR